MGKALDDASFASPWGRGEGVGAEEGVFVVREAFRGFLTGWDLGGEGGGEDTDRPLDVGFFLVTGSIDFHLSEREFYPTSRLQRNERAFAEDHPVSFSIWVPNHGY